MDKKGETRKDRKDFILCIQVPFLFFSFWLESYFFRLVVNALGGCVN